MNGFLPLLTTIALLAAAMSAAALPAPAQTQEPPSSAPDKLSPIKPETKKPETKDAPVKETLSDQQVADEQTIKNAGLKVDGPALLEFFKKRTLPDAERAAVEARIRQLGADSYRAREHAMAQIIAHGPVVLELLRNASHDTDPEIARRAEKCMERILEKDVAPEVPAAAARLLGILQPEGTVATLLTYLPFADNDNVADEVRTVLGSLAVAKGKVNPLLVAGLADKAPIRRAAAGEALCKAAVKEHLPAVRKLLDDPDAHVRFRLALALAYTGDRSAVSVLIDSLAQIPVNQAWQAEDVLFRLGEGKSPPAVSLGKDDDSRKKCRDAWHAWWKKEGAAVDLAKLAETPRLLGYTLLVLLDEGRVVEVDSANKTRWQLDNVIFPLDVQSLSGDRVLIAEYQGQRVTERSIKGQILWQKRIIGPLMAQRLPNGNTFIATDSQLLEYDPADKEVLAIGLPNGERIMKAMKLPSGEIACLTSEARIVRLDSSGKELYAFQLSLGARLFGGRIHMLPSGRVLVPHHAENKVVEYDSRGKPIWEVPFEQPIAAWRLPNGNTLVTSMAPARGAVEFDRNGNQVWTYRASTRVTRALRR